MSGVSFCGFIGLLWEPSPVPTSELPQPIFRVLPTGVLMSNSSSKGFAVPCSLSLAHMNSHFNLVGHKHRRLGGKDSSDDKTHRINPLLSSTCNRYASLSQHFHGWKRYFQVLLARVQSSLTTKEEYVAIFNKTTSKGLTTLKSMCQQGSLPFDPAVQINLSEDYPY